MLEHSQRPGFVGKGTITESGFERETGKKQIPIERGRIVRVEKGENYLYSQRKIQLEPRKTGRFSDPGLYCTFALSNRHNDKDRSAKRQTYKRQRGTDWKGKKWPSASNKSRITGDTSLTWSSQTPRGSPATGSIYMSDYMFWVINTSATPVASVSKYQPLLPNRIRNDLLQDRKSRTSVTSPYLR
ncbi:hypothetical protein AAG570_002277 [Ranatra chinensis]|uniref:Uncharacterized protein n=1 Tax=Ranatra chinensis TaxID=642074 RepID=A0ABD0Y740_9HEMI